MSKAVRNPIDQNLRPFHESVALYRSVDSSLHVWPFHTRAVAAFAAYYSLPAISIGIVTGVIGNVFYALANRIT